MADDDPGTWSHEEIDGKRIELFEPRRPADNPSVVLHLHADDLPPVSASAAYSAELGRLGLRCVSPAAKDAWWLDKISPPFDPRQTPLQFLLERVVPWIAERWETRAPFIALTGAGAGGQGVLQLAYRRPREFPVVAAVSAAVDFHNWHGRGLVLDELFPSREAARQATATLHVHPLNWPRHQFLACDPADSLWFEGVDRLAMKLSSMGIPFESDLQTSAGGDAQRYFETMARPVLDFVAQRLEQERNRP